MECYPYIRLINCEAFNGKTFFLDTRNVTNIVYNQYIDSFDGCIFVIDSNNRDDIISYKYELFKINIFSRTKTVNKDMPILVFANKQDLITAISVNEIIELIGIKHIVNRKWKVQGCSGLYGIGIEEGIEWLLKAIKGE